MDYAVDSHYNMKKMMRKASKIKENAPAAHTGSAAGVCVHKKIPRLLFELL